jgi:uncharacterized protein
MNGWSLICTAIAGALFGFGLACATMVKPEVVLSFLRFEDFGLLWVLGSAALVALLTYQMVPRLMSTPVFEPAFDRHSAILDRETLTGAAIFGVGWGISGVCPGPAIAGLGVGNWPLLIALGAMFAGALFQGWLAGQKELSGTMPRS